jgi:hypothetical protein
LTLQTVLGKVTWLATGEAGVAALGACIHNVSSSSLLSPWVSSSSSSPVVLRLHPSYIHGYWDVVHGLGSIRWVILALLVQRVVMRVIVWPLILEGYKGDVLTWCSFCC